MPWSSHSCNDRRYSDFTRNICKRYIKVAVGPKQSTNRHLEQIISGSTAPIHLKIGEERAYTMIYHKWIHFQEEATKLETIWLKIVTKRYDELCHKISQSSLPLKTDPVVIIFQHGQRQGSLYFFSKKVCNFDILP